MANNEIKGDRLLGILLKEHLEKYHHPSWREGVIAKDISHVPGILPQDARTLREYHEQGCLRERLESHPEGTSFQGWALKRKLRFYIRDGISDFFEKGLAENIIYE